MPIKSILESAPIVYTLSTSALTVAAGATAATATNYGNLTVGDLLTYLDDAGVQRYSQVAALPGAPNVTLETNAIAVTTANIVSIASNPTVPFFQPVDTENKVGVVSPDADDITLYAPPVRQTFDANEGFTIESIYLRIPYQFTMADGYWYVALYHYDATGTVIGVIDNVGETGGFIIPVENIETPVNVFVPTPGQAYRIHARLFPAVADLGAALNPNQSVPSISCLDMPAALNGDILPVHIGIRVEHAATALII